MSLSKAKSVLPSEVVAAHAKWGDKFIIIDYTRAARNKEGQISYYNVNIKLADGTEKPLYLNAPATKIYGCKTPAQRSMINGNPGPSFSFPRSVVASNGEPTGEAAYLIAMSWQRRMKVDKNDETLGLPDIAIGSFCQTKRGEGINAIPLDDPLIRIKIRTVSQKDNNLRRPVTVYTKNGKRTTAKNGKPFTDQNIHEDVKGGSTFVGVINFSQVSHSKQSYNNTACVEIMNIVPGIGVGLNEDDEIDTSMIDELKKLAFSQPTTVATAVDKNDPDDDEYCNDPDEDDIDAALNDMIDQ